MDQTTFDSVLVIDYGAQYAQLIARRVRECKVFSEILPHDVAIEEIRKRRPRGLILSGGPMSVYAAGAPAVNRAFFDLGIPVLGICYGLQGMAQVLGGEVAHTGTREYGKTELRVAQPNSVLFDSLPEDKDPTRRFYRQSSVKDIAYATGTLDISESIPLDSRVERTFERGTHAPPANAAVMTQDD